MKKLIIHIIISIIAAIICYVCFLFIIGDEKSQPVDRALFVFCTMAFVCGANMIIYLNND